jgi:small neutral amino acid transporter SnatA (MarC family)
VIVANYAVLLGLAQFIGKKSKGASDGVSLAPVVLRVVALLLTALAVEIIVLGLRGYGVMPPMPAGAGH